MAVVEATRQEQGLVEELADLGDQGEGAPGSGVTTGAGCDGDQPVYTGFCSLFGMAAGGDVMEHQAAVAVHSVHHLLHGAQTGDDDGHLLFHADGQVSLQAGVAAVDDQVDGVGGRIGCQASGDFIKPGGEADALALVQGGEAADDTGVATGQDHGRCRDQEHRSGDKGQTQAILEQGGQ